MHPEVPKDFSEPDVGTGASFEHRNDPEIEAVAPGKRKYRVIRRNGKITPFLSLIHI